MPLPIFVLAGQSNASRISSEVVDALDTQLGIGGYVLVRAYSAGAPLTRARDLKSDWNTEGELRTALLSDTKEALITHKGSFLAGTIWLQGEADTYGSASARDYAKDFLALFDGFYEGLYSTPGLGAAEIGNAQVHILNLSDNAPAAPSRSNWNTVQDAIAGLDAQRSWVQSLDPDQIASNASLSPSAMFSDGLHYSDAFSQLFADDIVKNLLLPSKLPLQVRFGTPGNDVFESHPLSEEINGGDGIDTVTYSNATVGIVVDLKSGGLAGGASGDKYISIENIHGTKFGDQISGDAHGNLLRGNPGDDNIQGYGGNDRLFGNSGDDAVGGGAGDDFLSGFKGDDRLSGGDGNDELRGGDGADYLNGGRGEDRLVGGSGSDTLDGGFGNDLVDYSRSEGRISVNLRTQQGRSGDAAGDLLLDIESVVASPSADYVYGDQRPNLIDGGAGNDKLRGHGGNDTISGGLGDDTIYGGSGNDEISGGAGSDVFQFIDGKNGTNVILDYEDQVDRFSFISQVNLDDVSIFMNGSDTHMSFGDSTIVLLGVEASLITADDFILS